MNPINTPPKKKPHLKIILILAIVAILMFGFGFALVPLYRVLCQSTGFNGKTNTEAVPLAEASTIDASRTITVQFVAITNANLPWQFYPKTTRVDLHPGENKLIHFFAQNNSDKPMVVQAIPSVSPAEAARYLKKTECFCFTQQRLDAHKSILMPVLFHLDKGLPQEVKIVSLSYTLFDASAFVQPAPAK